MYSLAYWLILFYIASGLFGLHMDVKYRGCDTVPEFVSMVFIYSIFGPMGAFLGGIWWAESKESKEF